MDDKSVIITGKDFQKIRNDIKKNNNKKIIFYSDSEDLDRKILEKENISVLLINQSEKKDFQKQRNSGFNQVMAKIAKKNNIRIGINLDEIVDAEYKEKSKIIARTIQNIMLCKKNNVYMEFIGKKHKRDIYDLRSLGLVLGMPTWMTKEL